MRNLYHVITNSGDMSVTLLDTDNGDVQVFNVKSDHPDYSNLRYAVEDNDVDYFLDNYSISQTVSNYVDGSDIEVTDGEILYNGQPLHGILVDKIFQFMDEGRNYQPLVNFLSNLMKNPSKNSVDQLYDFLQHKHLPITEDGCFMAYKSVRSDFTDHHTGRFTNTIGTTNKMPRNQVMDDADVGCSHGFHVGSLEYAKSFGGTNSRLMLVKVNPANVVSVPKDCSWQKCRVCEYTVVAEYKEPLSKCCYNY